MKFSNVDWKSANTWLREKQALLVEVYRTRDIEKVCYLKILILKDFKTSALAVSRVTTSSGARTPGLDGVIATTIDERNRFAQQVNKIVRKPSTYEPHAVKRV
jgi:hypothetical protein